MPSSVVSPIPCGDGPNPIETDALVIGAGPVGLFQVFQLGLLGVNAHVVDALPHAGGQCVELYGDKPIYDIPGTPVCTGRELTEQLLAQAAPFAPRFHFGQEVSALHTAADGRYLLETTSGTHFASKTVFIAAGVGAFQPKRLKLDGIERHLGTQVFHQPPATESWGGRHLLIVGGEDSAVQWACDFASASGTSDAAGVASVTLLHRRDSFKADPERIATLRRLQTQGRLRVAVGQPDAIAESDGRLSGLHILTPDGKAELLQADTVLVAMGLSPRLGPLADWGLALERKQLPVDTATFSTNLPGVFAVGDVNTYPGKKKLILCGFHEATLAAYGAMTHLHPDRVVHLQYTTTSPRLHQLLGIANGRQAHENRI